ncbi:MAG: lytic murein transglycosylase, partial [Thermodesulfobacteriaceae bacterium]|nr:lytic murein transglycosylase [Thermodesulfobacteriaceae bacterium]
MKLTKVSLSLFVVLLVLFSEMRSCKGQGINNETQEIRTCLEVFSLDVKPFAQSFLERVQRDLKDRVPENYIRELFCREDLNFNPQPMIKSLTWNEAKLPYHQFLEEGRIFRAKDFIEKNKELLQEIEKTFDVEKEIIVAIFLVETDLGRKRGVHQVFNTFFSLALAGEEELLKKYIDNNT